MKKKSKKSDSDSSRTQTKSKKADAERSPAHRIKKSAPAGGHSTSRMAGFLAPDALVDVSAPLEHGQVRRMGVVAGTVDGRSSPTACLGAGATDLCEIAPSGEIAVAGDTWKGTAALGPWLEWSPSLALHVGSLAGKVQFDGSFGAHGTLYQEGWRNLENNGVWGADTGCPVCGRSQLPAGIVQVGDKNYLLVVRTNPVLIPQDSRLVEIFPDGPGWPTVPDSTRPASYENFNQTQISGCEGPPGPEEIAAGAENREDAWVYIVADNFDRSRPVVLYRCRPEEFTNRKRWQGWGIGPGGDWAWGHTPEPLNSGFKFGELSLRRLADSAGNRKYVLSGFNLTTGQIEVRVADDVRQILRPFDPARPDIPEPPLTVVATAGTPTAECPTAETLPFLYGGYIVPGSTLDRARILVSQWDQCIDDQGRYCGKKYPYDVREYEVNLNR